MWRNTPQRYGWISINLHWLAAIVIIGMFSLGLWMTELGYYHPWYHKAPELHKAIGVLLFIVIGLRLLWRVFNPAPMPVAGVRRWEARLSGLVHWLLYILLFATMSAGYLFATAAGDGISVFGWFSVPALFAPLDETTVGTIHEWLAWSVIIVASLHALAAIKHHFIDKNAVLKRMLGMTNS